MIKFYDVDKNYVNYLRSLDSQVPELDYLTHDKFVCGIALNVNGIEYYAPISHFNQPQRTNLPIYDKGKIIATIRFCFMFPAKHSELIQKDFKMISTVDPEYANLLNTEYLYCKNNEAELHKKALSVHKIGINKNHPFNYTCCDFKKLEQNYMKYDRTITYPKI